MSFGSIEYHNFLVNLARIMVYVNIISHLASFQMIGINVLKIADVFTNIKFNY